jgi:hypothetical protein
MLKILNYTFAFLNAYYVGVSVVNHRPLWAVTHTLVTILCLGAAQL